MACGLDFRDVLHQPLKHAAIAGALSLATGVGMGIEDFGTWPAIYQAASLGLTIPAACLGGLLVSRSRDDERRPSSGRLPEPIV